jgi:hypothetical protein
VAGIAIKQELLSFRWMRPKPQLSIVALSL